MKYNITRKQVETMLELYNDKPKNMSVEQFLKWFIDDFIEIKLKEDGPTPRTVL